MSGNTYDEMSKNELRAACKAAGISHSKLTVAAMREALLTKHAPTPVVTTSEPVTVGAVIKVEREMRNDVKRPKEGGLCGQVWAALDELHSTGTVPTMQQVRDLATAKAWNQNNASIEFYQWKRFMGLSKPRVIPKRKKSVAKDAPPATRVDGSVDPLLA